MVEQGGPVIEDKSASHDLVTNADRASEQAVLAVLRRHRPQDAVLAEESGAHAGASDVRWVVDPLDGTTNFVHGRGDFAVSVAAERQGTVVTGAVYRPTDDEWVAGGDNEIRGSGAPLTRNPPPTPKKPVSRPTTVAVMSTFSARGHWHAKVGLNVMMGSSNVWRRAWPTRAPDHSPGGPQRLGREPVGRPSPLRPLASGSRMTPASPPPRPALRPLRWPLRPRPLPARRALLRWWIAGHAESGPGPLPVLVRWRVCVR